MRNTRLDLLIGAIILVIAYTRPCLLVDFFNTTLGRALILGVIVILASMDTLWAIFGVILLVSLRDSLTEGLTPMKQEKSVSVEEAVVTEEETTPNKVQVKGEVLSNADWQKAHCKDNKVILDGEDVPMNKLLEKFPDLEFLKGECNPCLSNCEFKLTTSGARVDAEEQLRSKDSNKLPSVGMSK